MENTKNESVYHKAWNNIPLQEWHITRQAILKWLREDHISPRETQDLVSKLHYYCRHDRRAPRLIYASLECVILVSVQIAKRKICALLDSDDDQALIRAYVEGWKKFCALRADFTETFIWLERAITTNQKKNLRNDMYDLWHKYIFNRIYMKLLKKIFHIVNQEREGNIPSSNLISVILLYIGQLISKFPLDLRTDLKRLEIMYIAHMRNFYISQSSKYLNEHGVWKYMRYAEEKIKEEEERASKYLTSYFSSLKPFTDRTIMYLVTYVKNVMLDKCSEMIANNEFDDLRLMYKLMSMSPDGVDNMVKIFKEYIVNQALADMTASANTIGNLDSEEYFKVLKELSNRYTYLVRESFNDDTRFLTAKGNAFEMELKFISLFRSELSSGLKGMIHDIQQDFRCPFLLAGYCDMLLKKTSLSKILTSSEIEERLKQMLLVLKYVQNKDVFLNYYKSHLQRRLIFDLSADLKRDEKMLRWLRDEGMSAVNIHKLVKMFEDVKISESFNRDLKESHINGNRGLDLTAKMLNEYFWNISCERIPVSLPMELETFASEVEVLYERTHNRQKLQWCHNLSTATITFSTNVGNFDLDVTTFQLVVLFTWKQKDRNKMSFEDLRLSTGLSDDELRRTLWSLGAIERLERQLLLFEPQVKSSKDFNDCTLFWVNDDFAIMKEERTLKQGRVDLVGKNQRSAGKR